MPASPDRAPPGFDRVDALCLCALAAMTWIAFRGVWNHEFIRFDDPRWIYENARVLEGLSLDGARWAFSTFYKSNWQPLTWLAHMLDVQLFGTDAGAHHAVSLMWHTANAGLLFVVMRSATGSRGCAFWVAAVFAVHPMHVESVAWASERKDVLSAFFGLLAIASWIGWVRGRRRIHYAAAIGCLALGLSAKPTLVTLPFVLLLLDYWPLGRLQLDRTLWPRIVEKLPLFALAAASAAVTLAAQEQGGAMAMAEGVAFVDRLANAVMSYGRYLVKTLWPADLALVYPHPNLPGGSPWQTSDVVAMAVVLTALTVAALRFSGRRYLAVGWLWFVGMLVPMIGLVQVGTQAMADRYTYLSGIGLSLMVAGSATDACSRSRAIRIGVAVLAGVSIAACMIVTQRQVRHWTDTVTLFEHSLAVAPGSPYLHNNLGSELRDLGQFDAAIRSYQRAIELQPEEPHYQRNLARAYLDADRLDDAIDWFRSALEVDPASTATRRSLAVALLRTGDRAAAVEEFRTIVRQAPLVARNHMLLAHSLRSGGGLAEALVHYRRAVELEPDRAQHFVHLGNAWLAAGDATAAVVAYRQAVLVEPDDPEIRERLALALRRQSLESAAEAGPR